MAARSSTWGPLRIGAFRAMWLGVLVSNVGVWMQTVGAQWLLVGRPHAAILVSAVQTADFLPDVAFGILGGVLADILDRRLLLIFSQAFLAVVAAALAILTAAGQMPPALLLTFTFLLGTGSVVSLPAYQSLVPELVPRDQVRSASALGSVAINLARAIGPAVAGVVIARSGAAAVFGLNALACLVYAVVVLAWREPPNMRGSLPEPFLSAIRAGAGYVRNSPVTLRLLLRAALFLVPASALWALLPLVATQRLRLGADAYGLMLGALGIGAIAGVPLLSRVRGRFSENQLVASASLVYAAALAGSVLLPVPAVVLVLLLPAGAAWVAVLSSINAALQLFLPAWVRARGLSVYQVVLFGSQGFGALAWGLVAEPVGLVGTFLVAALFLLAGAATIRVWPLHDLTGVDRTPVSPWPEPRLVVDVAPEAGPVLVTVTYVVPADREARFLEAIDRLRLARLRTGATRWGVFRHGETPRQFMELFIVPSWDEHLRQHRDRLTGFDRDVEEAVEALASRPPRTSHYIAAEPGG